MMSQASNQSPTQMTSSRSRRPTKRGEADWPDERPPLAEHLKREERRIKRVAAKATAQCPEHREDMEQELRLRVMRAWTTWNPERGPLSAHSWRHIVGGHIGMIRRTWTQPYGYRSSADIETAPSTVSMDATVGEDGQTFERADPDTRDLEVAEARADARLLVQQIYKILTTDGKGRIQHVNFQTILERLACVEPGDMVELAKRQGVSVQAIASSRNRAMATIKAAMEEIND